MISRMHTGRAAIIKQHMQHSHTKEYTDTCRPSNRLIRKFPPLFFSEVPLSVYTYNSLPTPDVIAAIWNSYVLKASKHSCVSTETTAWLPRSSNVT